MRSKLRNFVLAIALLALFVGGGFLLYNNWVVQRPFAVILFVSQALTPSTLAPARMYAGGANTWLEMESLPHVALLRSASTDRPAADEAAAARALATGVPTNNGGSVPAPEQLRPQSLLSIASDRGRAVGLVTNGDLSSLTLAAFHSPDIDPYDFEQTTSALLDTARPDVILGGGEAALLPEIKGGRRKDGRDLMLSARQSGYDILRNRSELANTPTWRAPKVLGVFAPGDLSFSGEIGAAGPEPGLAEMVLRAIELLQFNRKGYLLVVDAALPGRAAAANRGESLLRELIELDRAVAAAKNYAGESCVILVCGTVNPAGFQLNATGFRDDSGFAIFGKSPEGVPAASWATGPRFELPEEHDEPVAFPSRAAAPTVTDLLGLSGGSPPRPFTGFQTQSAAFDFLRESL